MATKLSDLKADDVLKAMGLDIRVLDREVDAASARMPLLRGKDGKETGAHARLTDGQYHAIAGRWFQQGNADGLLDLLKDLVVGDGHRPAARSKPALTP